MLHVIKPTGQSVLLLLSYIFVSGDNLSKRLIYSRSIRITTSLLHYLSSTDQKLGML